MLLYTKHGNFKQEGNRKYTGLLNPVNLVGISSLWFISCETLGKLLYYPEIQLTY